MENQFKVTIDLQQKKDNQYSGILKISTALPLAIESITIVISLSATGMIRPLREELVHLDLLTYSKALAIGIHEFPFDFSLANDAPSTYQSQYAETAYQCQAKIFLDDDNYRKLDISLFKNILTYVKKTNQIVASKFFDYNKAIKDYNVVQKAYELAFFNPTVLLIAGLIYVPSLGYILYQKDMISFFSIIFGLIFGGLIFGAIFYAIYYKLAISSNKIKVHISPSRDNQFQCKIVGLRLIRNPKIHYRIIEKITDKRGTSSRTYKETIYTSPIKTLPSSNIVLFEFPSDKTLGTFKLGDTIERYWEIVIKGNKNAAYAKFEVKN